MQAILLEWLDALKLTGRIVFERDSALETGILIVAFVLLMTLFFNLIAKTLTGYRPRVLSVLGMGFLILAAASAAALAFWCDQLVPQIISVAVALFVVVLPWTQRVQKTSYLSAFLLWVVVLLFVAAFFYGESVISQSVRSGAGRGSSLKRHNDQINTLFKETGR